MNSNDFSKRRSWGPEPKYPNVMGPTKDHVFSGGLFVVAGPCSVEGESQINEMVPALARERVNLVRGGVYRAGTYPGSDFGLKDSLLNEWIAACHYSGLKVVVEVLDIRQADRIAMLADALQVGARHMQDYALLKELSMFDGKVLLKRHPGSTLDEFLGAAEYLAKGRCGPVLVERGSSTHMNHVRWDLSISLIAAAKRMTGLPVLVDASHGTGRRDLVLPMTLAGVAAGADGLMVEVHPRPEESLSDADQAYPLLDLGHLIARAGEVFKVTHGVMVKRQGQAWQTCEQANGS